MDQLIQAGANRRRLPVRWSTAALLALAISYRGGLWLSTFQERARTIERGQPPALLHWLRDATLALPLVFVATLAALIGARWWLERRRWDVGSLAAVALLVGLIGGAASLAEAAASPLHDYLFQPQRLGLAHPHGTTVQPGSADLAGFGPAAPLPYYLYCKVRGALTAGTGSSAVGSPVTRSEFAALSARVRSLSDAGMVLLTNLVVTAGLLALIRERLWLPPARVAQPTELPA
jgi:hypothetical protein